MRNGSVCRKPPIKVMRPVTIPRKMGLPRPVSDPSSESPSEKAIEIPAPTAVGCTNQEDGAGVMRGKGCGKDGRERRDRAVHKAREAGLDDAQDEVLVVADDVC